MIWPQEIAAAEATAGSAAAAAVWPAAGTTATTHAQLIHPTSA